MGVEGQEGFDSNIEIYLRMRPHKVGIAVHKINEEQNAVQWSVPRQAQLGMVNHQREHYNFSFTGIFDMDAKQDVVFEVVAKKVVSGVLDGYNGTIFAYGQTGSGKTYTITGGAEKYAERGIIPRAISLIFSDLGKRNDYTYILHFSYVEIYNETGYDLLDPDHETKALEDLPKVTMMEDEENHIHLRNLSMHLATNEEEALNLLFIGDTNRMISATPMNMASSRSHCIFTITIEARKSGEDTVRRSKLHLVDLAGSERVSKTKVDGQILREAKYINLSLHFLEQVIIALQERSQGKPREHIPYRNSMMTSMLRDSLGGNCRTVMIATVSTAQEQLEETISTCRFAQRVAMVSNKVEINEEVDPNMLIRRLKQEISDLKDEIELLKGANGSETSQYNKTSTDIEMIKRQIINYVQDDSPDAQLKCELNMFFIRNAFHVFKLLVRESELAQSYSSSKSPSNLYEHKSNLESQTSLSKQIQELKFELQQRDNEINILVSFIRKHEDKIMCNPSESSTIEHRNDATIDVLDLSMSLASSRGSSSEKPRNVVNNQQPSKALYDKLSSTEKEFTSCVSNKLVLGRKQCFEVFCSNYTAMQSINENKSLLKSKYSEAKALGDLVNKAREHIGELKVKIEKQRVDKAMQSLVDGKVQDVKDLNMEDELLIELIDAEKMKYKEGFANLRDLKKEIEQLHTLLERSRVKLHDDFEIWLSLLQTPSGTLNSHDGLEHGPYFMENERTQPIFASSTLSTLSCGSMPLPLKSRDTLLDNLNPPPKNVDMDSQSCEKLLAGELLSRDNQGETKRRTFASTVQHNQEVQFLSYTPPKSSDALHEEVAKSPSTTTWSKLNFVDPTKKTSEGKVMLTGNAQADADILAFYKARSDFICLKPQLHDRQWLDAK